MEKQLQNYLQRLESEAVDLTIEINSFFNLCFDKEVEAAIIESLVAELKRSTEVIKQINRDMRAAK